MNEELLAVQAANHRFVLASLDVLFRRAQLVHLPGDEAADDKPDEDLVRLGEAAEAAYQEIGEESALDRLADAFELDLFARDVVLLCVAFEVDSRFLEHFSLPSIAFALMTLPGAHWAAFSPTAPLRAWGIVALDDEQPFVVAPMRVSPDILAFVLSLELPPSPGSLFLPLEPPETVVQSHIEAAESIAGSMKGLIERRESAPVVELHGADSEERRLVASACADLADTSIDAIDVRDLPGRPGELEEALRNWGRRTALDPSWLLVEVDEHEADPLDRDRVRRAVAMIPAPLFVSGPAGVVADPVRPVLRCEVGWPTADERLELWQDAVDGPGAESLDFELAALAEQYRLGPSAIEAVCAEAGAEVRGGGGDLVEALRGGCRRRTRVNLEALADRVDLADLPRLVLPEREQAELDELELHLRHAFTVHRQWGLDQGEGAAVSAMFTGPSGTGKTLAAKELARRTGLDLYRVDLSLVVSKYIGETEKNLRRVFDGAAMGGAILLFDEADALFGKRSEANDSRDRYANLEVSYLLQKMEQARAPVVLTTNLGDTLDPAFQRRLSFVIEFPFPDEAARRQLWESVFPDATPTEGLDSTRLARLAVNGAGIRNIAVRAAFLAASEDSPVTMRHLLDGTRGEFRKSDRDLPVHQVADWA